jgi:hypothetical protein
MAANRPHNSPIRHDRAVDLVLHRIAAGNSKKTRTTTNCGLVQKPRCANEQDLIKLECERAKPTPEAMRIYVTRFSGRDMMKVGSALSKPRVGVAGVERSEPPVHPFRGLTSFDPGHPMMKS